MTFKPFKLATITGLLISTLPITAMAQDIGDPNCDSLLLVSSYRGDNVKIFNACDGSPVRDLDNQNRLDGVQAIALDPNGDLVVVSEENGRFVRYHRDSLTYDAVIAGDKPETGAIEPAPLSRPTGLVIAPDGRMFAGSYPGNTVNEIDPATGQVVKQLASLGNSGVRGPDTGMWLDGNRLIIPGFDSASVVQADIDSADSDSILVAAGAGGMNAPRTVLMRKNGNLLVTSWRGSQVLEFDGDSGEFIRLVATITRPTGMAFESDEVLLVASDANNNVRRVRISDGEVLGVLIPNVSSPTFILKLQKGGEPKTMALEQNRAFWTIGVGSIEGTTITVPEMILTTGGVFGPNLDPATIDEAPWGSLEMTFDGCDSGYMSYQSNELGFDQGGYAISRVAPDAFGDACKETGFDQVTDNMWMNGLWFGGPARDGEGFSVNLVNGGLVVVTWYSYLPQEAGSVQAD